MIETAPPKRNFFVPVESLRGLAALLVVIFHIRWITPFTDLNFIRNGYLMVDFFFLLSGFVIAYNYENRLGSLKEIGTFTVLRLGRLYPLHVFTLGLAVGLECLRFTVESRLNVGAGDPAFGTNNLQAFLTNLTLTHSLGINDSLTFNKPSWSISVELYTYLIFAFVCLVVSNRRLKGFAYALISAAALVTLISLGRKSLEVHFDYGIVRGCLSFFLGGLCQLAYVWISSRNTDTNQTRSFQWPFGIALGLCVGLLCWKMPQGQFDYLVPLAAFFVVLFGALVSRQGLTSFFFWKPIVYLGTISYSTYMNHYFFHWITKAVLMFGLKYKTTKLEKGVLVETDLLAGTVAMVFYLAAVLIFSHFTYRLIEEPLRNRTKAFVKRRAAAA